MLSLADFNNNVETFWFFLFVCRIFSSKLVIDVFDVRKTFITPLKRGAVVQHDIAHTFIFGSTTCIVSHIIYYSYVFQLSSFLPLITQQNHAKVIRNESKNFREKVK